MKRWVVALSLALVFACALTRTTPTAQSCQTCGIRSNIDFAAQTYAAGWGFECGTGALLSHFDAYYYDASGGLHRLTSAWISLGGDRPDVYSYFLNGGGCPSVPTNSGLAIYYGESLSPGTTVAIVLWYGSIYSTQYVTVQ